MVGGGWRVWVVEKYRGWGVFWDECMIIPGIG